MPETNNIRVEHAKSIEHKDLNTLLSTVQTYITEMQLLGWTISIDQGESIVVKSADRDLFFARLYFSKYSKLEVAEVVFPQGKTIEEILS